jgi:hypothetical protein
MLGDHAFEWRPRRCASRRGHHRSNPVHAMLRNELVLAIERQIESG